MPININFLVICVCPELPQRSISRLSPHYSETCIKGHHIKQTPSIKWTVAEVPKFISPIYFK